MFTHDQAIADNTSAHDTATVQDFIRRYDDTIAAADFDTLPRFFDEQVLVITPTSSRCVTRAEFVVAAEARAHQMASSFRIESTEQANAEPLARESYSSPGTALIEQVQFGPTAHGVDSLSCSESIERVGVESPAGREDSAPRTELVEQATVPLGGHCWLTSAHWQLSLGDRTLDLYSDFLVRRTDNDLRIAAYLSRQDLPRLLRAAAGQV